MNEATITERELVRLFARVTNPKDRESILALVKFAADKSNG